MVMVAAIACRLEAGDAVADVDPLDEPQLGERVERPVDARDADAPPAGADAVVDLLRGEAAPLLVEEGDDRRAGAAAAQAGALRPVERVVGPGHGVR